MRSFVLRGTPEPGQSLQNRNIATAWDLADVGVRAPIERVAYWASVAAVLVGALARQSAASDIVELVERLGAAFRSHSTAEPAYWSQLFELAKNHFRLGVGVGAIRRKISETPRQAEPLLVLYLALMNHPDASPSDICGAQVVSLSTLKDYEPMARAPVIDLARVIQSSWGKIADERAFSLSAPKLIRDTLSQYTAPTIPNATRILLSAQAATGTKLGGTLHRFLTTLATDAS